MNKKAEKQLQNFKKELKKGEIYLKGKNYYNKEGKMIPFPSTEVMKEILKDVEGKKR